MEDYIKNCEELFQNISCLRFIVAKIVEKINRNKFQNISCLRFIKAVEASNLQLEKFQNISCLRFMVVGTNCMVQVNTISKHFMFKVHLGKGYENFMICAFQNISCLRFIAIFSSFIIYNTLFFLILQIFFINFSK